MKSATNSLMQHKNTKITSCFVCAGRLDAPLS